MPADFDPGEQIGLRPRQFEQPRRFKPRIVAENLRVRDERHRSAAPVGRRAQLLQRPGGDAAREFLREQFFAARDFDAGQHRQRVDHRHAHPVQTAAGGIGLARKFAARMQRGQDYLQRRFAGKLGVFIHRNAAPVVGDGQAPGGAVWPHLQRHFNAVGMARNGLVHGVVQHLCGEVVQRALVGAADIHAGAAADGFQPLQHLDCRAVIGFAKLGCVARCVKKVFCHSARIPCAESSAQGEQPKFSSDLKGCRQSPNRAGAGLITMIEPPLACRTSSARSITPVERKRNAPSSPRNPPWS